MSGVETLCRHVRSINEKNLKSEIETFPALEIWYKDRAINEKNLKSEIETPEALRPYTKTKADQ